MTRLALVLPLLAACGSKEPTTPDSDPGVAGETNDPPQLAEVPPQTAWLGEAFTLDLAPWVSDDGAPAVDLDYAVLSADGGFEGSSFSHAFSAEGEVEVQFSVSDAEGLSVEGAFTVTVAEALAAAESPDPFDGAWDIPVTTALAWAGGGGAEGFDVYLSADPLAVSNADTTSAAYMGRVTEPGWTPPAPLSADTAWYWRVDAALGDATLRGPVWTFDTEPGNHAPLFDGLLGTAAAGGEAAQLSWSPGVDPEGGALTYAVYIGSSANEVGWDTPAWITEPGVSGVVLTAAELADIAPEAELWFGVRAVDPLGVDDGNTVAVPLTMPSASAPQLFVDASAGSGGTGSLSDPFDALQDAIEAAEAAGGGVILVAEGDYSERFQLSDSSGGPIWLFGGLPTLSSLDASASQVELLEARDAAAQITRLHRSGTLIDLDNGGRPVHLGGLTLDSQTTHVDASDAALLITESRFVDSTASGATDAVIASANPASATLDLQIFGSELAELHSGVVFYGAVERVTFANNDVHDLVAAVFSPNPANGVQLLAPGGGEGALQIAHNRVFRVGSLIDQTDIATDGSGDTGALHLQILDNSVQFTYDSNAVELQGVGAAGPIQIDVEDNLFLGVTGDCVNLGIDGVEDDVTLRFLDNACVHSTGDGFEVRELISTDGSETHVLLRGNRFSHVSNSAIELVWEDTANVNDAGVITAEVIGNRFYNSADSVYVSVSGGEGLESWVLIADNLLGSALGDSLDLRNATTFDRNGDPQAQAEANFWIAHNDLVGSIDGEAARISVNANSLLALRNNAIGFNDLAASEALELSHNGWGGGHVDIRNNVFAWSAGDGLYISSGVLPQLVNNTVAYAGRNNSRHYGVDSHGTDGHSQTFVHNSLLFEAAGEDLDAETWASWSLTGDGSGPGGYGSVVDDPLFIGQLDDELGDFDAFFRLSASSPALDAGDPADAYNDPDGSRNDMGAFGGPGADNAGDLGGLGAAPFEVIGLRPFTQLHQNAWLISDATPLRLLFSGEVNASTVSTRALFVRDSADTPISGTFDVDGRVVTFTPSAAWPAGEVVEVEVSGAVIGADGQANRFTWVEAFAVAPSADTAERENNNSVANAQAITDPVFHLSGDINSGGSDNAEVFSLSVSAGQRLRLSTFCERIGSDGEVRVELLDSSGDSVKWSSTLFGAVDPWQTRDAYLDHVFEADGTYYLVLTETRARSRVDWALQGWVD